MQEDAVSGEAAIGVPLSLATAKKSSTSDLRQELMMAHGLKLLRAEDVKAARGLSTGFRALDEFLASGGFPCGEISLLECSEGLGASTLWLECAARVTQAGRRVSWINGSMEINPVAALQRGVSLQNLFIVPSPSRQKTLWSLQEIFSSNLFDLVGCDLGDVRLPLRESRSLLAQARRSGTALVILSRIPSFARELAALAIRFENGSLCVQRANHRPVPHSIERRLHHVDFISGPIDSRFLLAGSYASLAGSRNLP